jgi:glycosyltransferase involved in cell wall biosynthesis
VTTPMTTIPVMTTDAPRSVLLVTLAPPFPPTDGHKTHLWNLVRALCAEGWSITLVSFAEFESSEVPEALGYLCREVRFVHRKPGARAPGSYRQRLSAAFSAEPSSVRHSACPEMAVALERQLREHQFAAVVCDEIYSLPNLPPALAVPVIVDTQGVPHELLRACQKYAPSLPKRFYLGTEAAKVRRWEARQGRKAFALSAVSERQARLWREMCPQTRVVPIPNVVDASQYEPSPSEEQEDVVLFSGSLDSLANRDAVEFFASRLLPELVRFRPRTRFRVPGACQSAHFLTRMAKHPNVEVAASAEEMRREIARATVCVVPVRIPNGTQLQILEAAAMAKPVVSTSMAADGLQFAPGTEIAIVDDSNTFVRELADLLANAHRRREMGQRARQRVERDYNLGVLRQALCALLDPLARPRSIAASGGVSS